MKQDTHPKYHDGATVECACGKKHKIGSTKEKINVEICSNCHPFYTGDEQLIDTAGRAEKFKQRRESAKKSQEDKSKKDGGKEEKEENKSKTEKMVEKANEKLNG